MSNVMIGAPNWCDYITSSALALGTWSSTLPRANLLNPLLSVVAATSGVTTAATQFNVDLGATLRGVNIIAIPKHNMTAAALWRVKCGTAAFTADGAAGGTVVYDSGWVLVTPVQVYPPGSVAWGHTSMWSGALDPIMDTYNRAALLVQTAAIVGRYWWFGFNDTANTAGYVELSRLCLMAGYQPSLNFVYGANFDITGEKVAEESIGGVEFVDPRNMRRVANINLADIPEAEAFAILPALQMYLRYDRQAFFCWDPSDTYHKQRRGFLCKIKTPGALSEPYFQSISVPLSFSEEL